MQDHEIGKLVDAFHTKSDDVREALWLRLREHGVRVMPFFADLFPNAKWFQVRRDIAFYAIRFARASDAAFAIGRMALEDKSRVVRYRGCCVLAYSLRPDALPVLEKHVGHADPQTVEHVKAAMDAIESRNHHYFVDRDHSGRSFWSVDGDATGGEPNNQPLNVGPLARPAPPNGSAMITRHLPLLVAVLLACTGRAHAARILEHYDVDSLSAMAKLIVKAEVGEASDVQTRDGNCAVWDVKVLSVLNGDVQPESVIRVAGIEEYKKGPGIDGVGKGFPRLSKGDVVYLFLLRKGDRGGYAMYDLTGADWKVIESGARLVAKDGVHSFGQYFPPGPSMGPVPGFVAMTEKTFPKSRVLSVEEFEKRVRKSLAFVSDLRTKLAANALTEAGKREVLAKRPEVLKREWARSDYIPWLIYDEPRQPATRPAS